MKANPIPSLYVYYRIPRTNVMAARDAASRMVGLIEEQGLDRPQVMRRPEADAEGRQTWMEIYASWDAGSAHVVERALADSGLGALIEGPRHPELFIDLPPLDEGEET